MTKMRRRAWLHAAAATAGGAVLASVHPWNAEARQAKTPPAPKPGYPSRPAGKIEILFKAPGQSANGMQCTDEGIWTIDVAGSRTDTPGRCKVYLSSYEGKLLRELAPEGTGPSGIGVDADNKTIWIGSTYSREIIRSDAKTGETIEKHFTPGAGVIYRMTTDVPPRPDTYGRSVRPPSTNGPPSLAATPPSAGVAGGRAGAGATGARSAASRRMVSALDAAARSQATPAPSAQPAGTGARTASRPRTASSGSPSRRAG